MDRHARPANCDAAKPTRVNAGIYRQLGEYTKKRDFNLYKIQQVLIKGIIPVIKIADLCMSSNLNGEKGQQAKRLALESLSLLTHTNYESNIQRKLFMKPDIGKDYTALCSPHVPFTDWLFGDDLQRQLKDIGDENKIGARVLPSHNKFHKASKNFRGQEKHTRRATVVSEPTTKTMNNPQNFKNKVGGKRSFWPGQVQQYSESWKKLTSDKTILSIIEGYKIEFDTMPEQIASPNKIFTNAKESQIVAHEIEKLLKKGVLHKVNHTTGEFLSNIFLRAKKDSSYRLILNLKNLNQSVTYKHFKMETLASALQLIKPNCYMVVLDLKDAYYSVPIFSEHRKFLRFQFEGSLYEFTCLPNRLSSAPHVFTKLMKPLFAFRHGKGILLVGYIDDVILIADSKEALELALDETIAMIINFGFTINYDKSSLVPSQQACFLGFLINSVAMEDHMTPAKSAKLIPACQNMGKNPSL